MNQSLIDQKELVQEALRIIKGADERGVIMRIMGGVAIHLHCPNSLYIHERFKRVVPDIDLATYQRFRRPVEELHKSLNYELDKYSKALFQGKRYIFYKSNGLHTDVFFDKLEMCHDLDFEGRLELDHPTMAPADLLLQKMQIHQINEKDFVDTIMLLKEHRWGGPREDAIERDYIATILSRDWGLCKTFTVNLDKVEQYLNASLDKLTPEDAEIVRRRVGEILAAIEAEPKTLRWKMRAKLGERVQWYRDVEEVVR